MHRILTERKNPMEIKALLKRFGLDYTVFEGQGSWQGLPEDSMAIELEGITADVVEEVARLIKVMNKQEAVPIQTIPATSIII